MDAEVYFKNNVLLGGKAVSIVEDNDDFLSFNLETREVWPEGETLTERHEVRYYKTSLKPSVAFDAIAGRLVEISGRVRVKENAAEGYRPFIHCHKLNLVSA